MQKTKTTLLTQLILRGIIFILFFLSLFVAMPSFIVYLLLLFIIANVVFGFINKKINIFPNIVLFGLALLLLVFLIEYIATIVGTLVSFLHLLFFFLYYLKGGEEKEKKKKVEKVEVKK